MNKKLLAGLAILIAVIVGIWLWLRSKKAAAETTPGDAKPAGPNDYPTPGDPSSGDDPGTYTPEDDGESPTDGEEYDDPQAVDMAGADTLDVGDSNSSGGATSSGSGVKPPPDRSGKAKPGTTGLPKFMAPGKATSASTTQKQQSKNVPRVAPDGDKWVRQFATPKAGGGSVVSFLSSTGRYKMRVTYATGGYPVKVENWDLANKVFGAPKSGK